jgi:hypothetical protein
VNLLVIVIFLLSNGKPANKADVYCDGLNVYEAGDDKQTQVEQDAGLILDSRGAIVFEVPQHSAFFCWANYQKEKWSGVLHFDSNKRQYVSLR